MGVQFVSAALNKSASLHSLAGSPGYQEWEMMAELLEGSDGTEVFQIQALRLRGFKKPHRSWILLVPVFSRSQV